MAGGGGGGGVGGDSEKYLLLLFTTVLCQWDFSMGNSGCLPRGKPTATQSRYLTYGTYRVFSCFHNPPNSDTDYGIINVRTDVNACDRTRGVRTP